MTVESVCSSSGSEWPPSAASYKNGAFRREREIERAVEGQERDRER